MEKRQVDRESIRLSPRRIYKLRKKCLYCHSERSEESFFDCKYGKIKEGEILRFAQNDRTSSFSAACVVDTPTFFLETFEVRSWLIVWSLGSAAVRAPGRRRLPTALFQRFRRKAF